MSLRIHALAALLLLPAAVACSPSGPAASPGAVSDGASPGASAASPVTRVEPEDVAERLLTQLRDEDYSAAHETLSTGQARDFAANQLDLMTRLMSADTLVREWSLDDPAYITVDEQSKVEVDGTVTFDDGGTGSVRIVMRALGLQADPWRIDEFELTRD